MTGIWFRRATVALSAAVLFAFVLGSTAEARNPADVFRGKVITAKKPIPTRAKSKRRYIRKVRKLKKRKFWEDEKKKEWKIYYAAYFRRPLNDLEVTIKLYDITGGKKHMITSFQQYVSRRGMRVLNSHIELERKFFGVNKRILMVVENRNRTLAATKFKILGEGPKYDGKVDFTGGDDKKKGKD